MSDRTTGYADPPERCSEGHFRPRWYAGWKPCTCPAAIRRTPRGPGHRTWACGPCLDEGKGTTVCDPPCEKTAADSGSR